MDSLYIHVIMCYKAYIPPGVFGHVGVNNAIDFAFGTIKMIFILIKIIDFKIADFA